jgi:hypothetical protein
MRIVAITLLVLASYYETNDAAQAQQSSCKVCTGSASRLVGRRYFSPNDRNMCSQMMGYKSPRLDIQSLHVLERP